MKYFKGYVIQIRKWWEILINQVIYKMIGHVFNKDFEKQVVNYW